MTQEQQKVLEQFDDSTLFYFLREIRHKAFISWGTGDVIGVAKNLGFEMNEDTAVNIISEIDRRADASNGISWDTVDYYVNEWIQKNSFEVNIKVHSAAEEWTAMFCSLESNENIENFWNDDDYYFYGKSKEELKKFEGKTFIDGDCIIVKVN